jgi:D-serine deaminase-like pyridoxal phosphate-dependent protein
MANPRKLAAAQHLRGWEERRQAIAQAADKAGRTCDLLACHGIECPTVTKAGTGTFEFGGASGIDTELQCGSYMFMDAHYGCNLDRDGAPTKAFEPSLYVWATVMSRPAEDRAIVDAGLKALVFYSGPPLVCDEPAAPAASAPPTSTAGSASRGRRIGSTSATSCASSPATATPPSTSTTGTSASAATASSSSGR